MPAVGPSRRLAANAVELWCVKQEDQPSRSESFRRLVEIGLAVAPAVHSEKVAAKANELAGKAIDRMSDKGASAEEQASRKRKLLKGPEEFRDVRVDRAKQK